MLLVVVDAFGAVGTIGAVDTVGAVDAVVVGGDSVIVVVVWVSMSVESESRCP